MPKRLTARLVMASLLVAGTLVPLRAPTAAAVVAPQGFAEQIVYSGLTQPTDLEFSPDGRVFVAEKSGRIKVFDDLSDTTPTLFADLSTNVHNSWDRGLLGLALPPNFPASPWVYVLYTYDAPPGRTAPVYNDDCSVVSGAAHGGNCVVTGRLSKLAATGNVMTGSEQVLITDWCQQFPSHSIGDLEFGADGMLYATGGDGASFSAVDYGQLGSPINPCGDPPGGSMAPPGAQGGALRAQDLRTSGDRTSLNGALLRLDPPTGAAAPGNPLSGSSDTNARRVVAYGLRNPYRFTMRPGTSEAWISETGWSTWEEVNRATSTTSVTNFGWPCYEGTPRQAGYDAADLSICENLYAAGGVTGPYVAWSHASKLVAGEACPTGSSSSTGIAFYPAGGGPYPASYNGAAFFADYSRRCIWAMLPSTPGGLPSSTNIRTFASSAASPVDLELGPGNELYYVDLAGTVRRFRYYAGNQPPTAVIEANPTSGPTPLTVNFTASGSTDPDPADQDRLTYAWDFTNDGSTDSTAVSPTHTYASEGSYTAQLTVRDTLGATHTATVTITPGNSAPTAVIDAPAHGTRWRVGDTITFGGHATDPQQGTLPASALTWRLRLEHCATNGTCHTHQLQEFVGVSSGSFLAPDHDYPTYLELDLVATDADGLTGVVTRRLDPRTVNLSFATKPDGLRLVVGGTSQTTPFAVTAIQGATLSVSAPTPQTQNSRSYVLLGWSDIRAQTHTVTAPAAATTYTATYSAMPTAPVPQLPNVSPVKVAASRLAQGHAVYVRGLDGRIWWRTVKSFSAPGYSTSWRPLDGLLASGPDVTQLAGNGAFLAARTTASTLAVRWQDGPTFGPWHDLGGIITSAPTVMRDPSNSTIWVFARGTDGGVWYRSYAGSWGPWRTIGGKLTSAPDVVASPGPRVYGRGTDGLTWVRSIRPDGTWGPWAKVGRPVNSATSTVNSAAGPQIQYWRGTNRHTYRAVGTSLIDLGGLATSAPDASYNGEIVLVRGDNNGLFARINGASWVSLGGKAS
jgi:glucose/arabinose dehydrogenase/PKD repeat protein